MTDGTEYRSHLLKPKHGLVDYYYDPIPSLSSQEQTPDIVNQLPESLSASHQDVTGKTTGLRSQQSNEQSQLGVEESGSRSGPILRPRDKLRQPKRYDDFIINK